MNEQEFVHNLKYDLYTIERTPPHMKFLKGRFVKLSRSVVGIGNRHFRMLHPTDKQRIEDRFRSLEEPEFLGVEMSEDCEYSGSLSGVILMPIEMIKQITIPDGLPKDI